MKYKCEISYNTIKNIPVIFINGDLTLDANVNFNEVFSRIEDSSSMEKIIINFEKTNYIDSSGISYLMNIINAFNKNNGAVAFVGMSDYLLKQIDILGIMDFVQIYNSNEEASKSL